MTRKDKTREELEVQRDLLKEKIDSFQKQILRLESSTGNYCAGASIATLICVVLPLVEAWRQRRCIRSLTPTLLSLAL
jgi:hypothetical protein